jgi:hypothetical protein
MIERFKETKVSRFDLISLSTLKPFPRSNLNLNTVAPQRLTASHLFELGAQKGLKECLWLITLNTQHFIKFHSQSNYSIFLTKAINKGVQEAMFLNQMISNQSCSKRILSHSLNFNFSENIPNLLCGKEYPLSIFLKSMDLIQQSLIVNSEIIQSIRKSIEIGPRSLLLHLAQCFRNDPLNLPQSMLEANQLEFLAQTREDNLFVEQYKLPQLFPAIFYFDSFKPLQKPFHPKVEEGILYLKNDKMKVENQISALKCFREAANENSVDGCFFFGVLLYWNNFELHFANEEEDPNLILLKAIHLGSLDALLFYLQKNRIENANPSHIARIFNHKLYLTWTESDFKTIIKTKNSYWIRHLLKSMEEEEDPNLILLKAIHLGYLDALMFYLQKNYTVNAIPSHIAEIFNPQFYFGWSESEFEALIKTKNSYWIRHFLKSMEEDCVTENYSVFLKYALEDKLTECEESDISVVCPGDYWL